MKKHYVFFAWAGAMITCLIIGQSVSLYLHQAGTQAAVSEIQELVLSGRLGRANDRARVLGASVAVYNAVTDGVVRAEPAAPDVGGPLGAGALVAGPDYGTKILRVTDANTNTEPWNVNKSYVTPGGGFENPWNANSDIFWVSGPEGATFFRLDPLTLKTSKLLKPDNTQMILPVGGPFSFKRPNIVYTRIGSAVKEYDLNTFASANVFDIAALYPSLAAVSSQAYVPAVSNDDSKVAIAFGGNQDAYPYIVFYDRSVNPPKARLLDTGYRGSCPATKPQLTVDGAATAQGGGWGIHSAYLDRTGRFVIIAKGACRYATDKSPEWAVWDTQTGTVQEFGSWSGHDVAGFGTRINQSGSDSFCSFYEEVFWISRPLDNLGSTQPLISCDNAPTPHPGATGGHWSWANARPDLAVPIVGTIDRNRASASAWRKWDNEIVAVASDGSGTAWRFAHTFSDWRVGGNFWDSARGNVSPDGRFYIFTSNWQKKLGTDPSGQARQDVFLADLFSAGAPASDTVLPTVSITAPASGSAVSGLVPVTASAADNAGVAKTEFYLDSALKATDTASPYAYSWDTTAAANGTHTLMAKAYDAAGNSAAAYVTVTVNNSTAAKLLFKSGFEANTSLAPLVGNSGMVQEFSGTDQATGFSWPPAAWNPAWGGLQVIAGTANPEPMTAYFGNTLDTGTVYAGSRSLLLKINKDVPQTTADQVAFEYVGFSEPVTGYYLRARARLNPELLSQVQKVRNGFWRMLWEMKTTSDYRNKVEIYGSENGVPYWHVSADNNANNTRPPCPANSCWGEDNFSVPVPLDQWFTYEVYLKRSAGPDGRFAFAVNGQMVADHYGPNYGAYNEKVAVFMHTNLYGPFGEIPDMLPAYQWLDDVEIYDAPPCAAMPCSGGTVPADTQAPSVPGSLAATAVSSSQINLSWTAAADNAGVAGYKVYRDGVQIATTTATGFSNTGLAAGTTYAYSVSAFDAAGNTSAQSAPVTAATQALADVTPPAISGVSAVNVTQSSATITWMTNEPADSLVDFGASAGYGLSSGVKPGLVTAHSVDLSGLSGSVVYHYRVSSKDATGNLARSQDLTFTTAGDTAAPAITAVVAANTTSSTTVISWITDEPADSAVEYGQTSAYGQITPPDSALVVNHSQALAGLAASNTYHYRVKSKDKAGNVAYSPDGSFTTVAAPAANPAISNVFVADITTVAATITWNTDRPATSQVYYGRTASLGSQSALSAALATSHSVTLTGLAKKTKYYYKVESKDSAGNLVASGIFSFITKNRTAKPAAVTKVTLSSGSVVLSWENPQEDDYWRGTVIYKGSGRPAPMGDKAAQVADFTQNTFHDKAVAPGQVYYYTIATYDDQGNYSDPVTAKAVMGQDGALANAGPQDRPAGLPAAFPSGSLVNDAGTVYFIYGQYKTPFTSMKAFLGLGYSLDGVVAGDTSAYVLTAGYMLSSASQMHPWGSWVANKGTVYYSHSNGFIPVPSWATFLSNKGDPRLIVKANAADLRAIAGNPGLPVLAGSDERLVSP